MLKLKCNGARTVSVVSKDCLRLSPCPFSGYALTGTFYRIRLTAVGSHNVRVGSIIWVHDRKEEMSCRHFSVQKTISNGLPMIVDAANVGRLRECATETPIGLWARGKTRAING